MVEHDIGSTGLVWSTILRCRPSANMRPENAGGPLGLVFRFIALARVGALLSRVRPAFTITLGLNILIVNIHSFVDFITQRIVIVNTTSRS